jgi:hypothetical protein
VNDRHAFALAPGQDQYESRYQRTVDQVYAASLDVVKRVGVVSRETVLNPGANQAKVIEAKVKGRKVWIRVEAVDQSISSVTVQVRTSGGGKDQELTADLQKQIGIALARQT